MMKKWPIFSLLIVCLAVVLAACGNTEQTKQDQEPEESEQPSVSDVAKAKKLLFKHQQVFQLLHPFIK